MMMTTMMDELFSAVWLWLHRPNHAWPQHSWT